MQLARLAVFSTAVSAVSAVVTVGPMFLTAECRLISPNVVLAALVVPWKLVVVPDIRLSFLTQSTLQAGAAPTSGPSFSLVG